MWNSLAILCLVQYQIDSYTVFHYSRVFFPIFEVGVRYSILLRFLSCNTTLIFAPVYHLMHFYTILEYSALLFAIFQLVGPKLYEFLVI